MIGAGDNEWIIGFVDMAALNLEEHRLPSKK
jgi:hypothetical protein